MYDYQGAISAGANPSDVTNYLAKNTGYNAQGALSAGADPTAVLKYMSNLPFKTSQPVTQPIQPDNSLTQISKTGSDLVKSTNEHAGNIVQDLSEKPSFAGASDVLGNVASEGGDILGGLIKTGAQATLPKPIYDFLSNLISEGVKGISNTSSAKGYASEWNKLSAQYPEATKSVSGIAKAAGLALGADEGPTVEQGVNAVKTGVKTAGEMALDSANTIKNGITDTASGVKNLATNGLDASKVAINGKTLDEILSTPEKDVYKLSAPERKAYYDAQQEKITTARTTADQKVKADLQTKSEASQAKADALNRQLQVASRDKVISLRPQIRSAMAEQSATYRKLVDEAIAPHAATPVDTNDLKSFVESRFPDNPGMSDAVKQKLGLTTEKIAPKEGELPTVQTAEPQNPNTTIGDIYNQTKSLKQDISAGASKGTKVFTPDDKLTDDSISTLSDYLKSKGVDLSEANKFWSKYAPVRNQLVAEAKPFLQVPTQTKTFANTLLRVAKGTDVNNENFISQVEDLVGQPINNENKTILSKLDESQKEQLANEVSAQEKLLENKSNAESTSKNLTNKEFETNRLANRRTLLKRIFYTAGGLGIDKIVKNYTGIGI